MRASARQTRRPVKLSRPLHRDLSAYALAAGTAGVSVLALAQPADGQVVYTPAHEIIGSNGQMLIDFNHDGTTDIIIREIPCSLATSFYNANSLQVMPGQAGGGIRMGGYDGFAAALSARAKVGQLDPFVAGTAVMANWTNFGGYYFGSWGDVKSKYLGIRFLIEGETHYGWARLNAVYDPNRRDIVALLTGYAYETQTNGGIRAGDTGQNGQDANTASREALPLDPDAGRQLILGVLALGASGPSHRCGESREKTH
jgi:hypothetical protein